jgi:hypothetical protein
VVNPARDTGAATVVPQRYLHSPIIKSGPEPLSTNTKHWNKNLADRTGLRVAHPAEFLASLHP